MILYNTLTRKKQEFEPIKDNTVRMYSCGPTVYYTAHIGNMRAYICADILKKTLMFDGFEIFDVMNITDVGHLVSDADEGEDKMEKSAKALRLDPKEIARRYTEEFFRDTDALNIRRPQIIASATNHIDEMIEFVKGLEKKGYTYKTSDGVYFDASLFPGYSKLSGVPVEGNKGGARVDLREKRNLNDFALWKFCGDNVIQKWSSPWGVGCPGWHIECSAMALKYLGETFDIHTGGVDHVPIHHTNEIAQTECLTGRAMCNFFFHNEFMMVDNGKMSKSLSNAYTLPELQEKGYSPMAFRYFNLLANYRTILNFTFEGLAAAQNAYQNLVASLAKHFEGTNTIKKDKLDSYRTSFKKEITNDLNTPKAIAVIWQAIKEPASKQIYDLIIEMDDVLSLGLAKAAEDLKSKSEIAAPRDVMELAEERLKAKKNKDFASADALREKIASLGFELVDSKNGYELKVKG